MSAYSQQEELEQLKAWWKTYGNSLVVGVVIGVAILGGYRYWTDYRATQRAQASTLYDQMVGEIKANKPEARASGEKLISEYSSTPYSSMAALLLARQAYTGGDKAQARKHLEWALDHAKDPATQHAARLRLGRMSLDAGDIAAAAALLNVKDKVGFEAEYYELDGDIALAQGDKDKARAAYRESLKHIQERSPYAGILGMKLDDVGPEKPQ